MLQWAEWLRNCVCGGRETEFVNLDETPMAKQMPARRGYVCDLGIGLQCTFCIEHISQTVIQHCCTITAAPLIACV
jgi:hypothetical protein